MFHSTEKVLKNQVRFFYSCTVFPVPVRLNCFCCRADCGEGCRGEGGVALLGRGGAGEEGVEEVVDEGLLLESGWYGTEM